MGFLNMRYFWNRIKVFLFGREPDLEELSKILNRCLRVYDCINDLIRLFKLIEKFKVSHYKAIALIFIYVFIIIVLISKGRRIDCGKA